MDWDLILKIVPPVLYGIALGFIWGSNRRLRRAVEAMRETAEVALDVLDQMERAHDPGRDVHERLAFAIEASMIRPPDDGDDRPDPAGRRVAAMAVAANLIEAINRANLILTTGDTDDRDDEA